VRVGRGKKEEGRREREDETTVIALISFLFLLLSF